MQNTVNLQDDLETDELQSGKTLLYGQYTIERHLLDGGFGMTYLARDSLDRRVVIKECFPSTICRRVKGEVRPRKPAYQEQFQCVISNFLREALRLAKFEHPNIVKVHQVFQENNTAYFAMDYVDGMDLLSMLDLEPERLTDALLESLLRDTLNALGHVHSYGMLHRDISPDNLLLDSENNLTLIDFGAAREDQRRKTRVLSTVLSVKDGYSPHEFYYSDTQQDPSSDLYSVGATFYHVITGRAPLDCQQRLVALSDGEPDPYKPLASGAWGFSQVFLQAIDKALSVSQKERFQSVEEWLVTLETGEIEDAGHEAPANDLRDRQVTQIMDPDAPARELEPSLVAAISTLVEDTNSRLQSAPPKQADEAKKAGEVAEQKKKPNHVVDLFGSPIEDVDAWLEEQDKQSRRAAKAKVQDTPYNDPTPFDGGKPAQPHAEPAKGSAFSRMISSFMRKRRDPSEMAET